VEAGKQQRKKFQALSFVVQFVSQAHGHSIQQLAKTSIAQALAELNAFNAHQRLFAKKFGSQAAKPRKSTVSVTKHSA
jgi:stage III sporulation protein SpoIIIAA